MKLIIAGTRTFCGYHLMEEEWEDNYAGRVAEIVSGCARGADNWGRHLAANKGIPTKLFPAEWELYGKRAGFRRNVEMAEYADELLAFWDGVSSGTRHMIQQMRILGKPVKVVKYV